MKLYCLTLFPLCYWGCLKISIKSLRKITDPSVSTWSTLVVLWLISCIKMDPLWTIANWSFLIYRRGECAIVPYFPVLIANDMSLDSSLFSFLIISSSLNWMEFCGSFSNLGSFSKYIREWLLPLVDEHEYSYRTLQPTMRTLSLYSTTSGLLKCFASKYVSFPRWVRPDK